MAKNWWKILCCLLLIYTVVGGFLMPIPKVNMVYESARNLFFHVTMWMAMMTLYIFSFVFSLLYLWKQEDKNDIKAQSFATLATIIGVIGYCTGVIWANYTWVTSSNQSLGSILKEPKLVGAAIALLAYFAYFILRSSIEDTTQKAKVSAVYNIFAFFLLFPSIWIIPRLMEGLHPAASDAETGNPALNMKDLDSRMRLIFYPAVLGWTLLGIWIANIKIRIEILKLKNNNYE